VGKLREALNNPKGPIGREKVSPSIDGSYEGGRVL